MEIKAKTVLITGSTGKLGRAIALGLAEMGCNCVCHYHKNRHLAEQLADQIIQMGQKAAIIQADLREADQIDSLFSKACKAGDISILINSAAIFTRCAIDKLDFKTAQQGFALNVTAAVILCRRFSEALVSSGSDGQVLGKIINLTDISAHLSWEDYSLYNATKSALISITKSLAKELGPAVTINSISPGIVDCPDDFTDAQIQNQISKIPMSRFASTDEIVSAVKFLLANDYITGQELIIDGGRCL